MSGSRPVLDASRPVALQQTPAAPAPRLGVSFRALSHDVTLTVVEPTSEAAAALTRARRLLVATGRATSRFGAGPLVRANADPQAWHDVPDLLLHALSAAVRAHRETIGLFDPRVLSALRSLGYDRPIRVGGPLAVVEAGAPFEADQLHQPWRPELDRERGAVRLGPLPVDLGSIVTGLAMRWVAAELAGAGRGFRIDIGHDRYAGGTAESGAPWVFDVEDPEDGAPVARLRVRDAAVVSSSSAARVWHVEGRVVHHLVDPRTCRPSGWQLTSVTVVDPDPARADVWSTALHVAGPELIRPLAEELGLAALWQTHEGSVEVTEALAAYR